MSYPTECADAHDMSRPVITPITNVREVEGTPQQLLQPFAGAIDTGATILSRCPDLLGQWASCPKTSYLVQLPAPIYRRDAERLLNKHGLVGVDAITLLAIAVSADLGLPPAGVAVSLQNIWRDGNGYDWSLGIRSAGQARVLLVRPALGLSLHCRLVAVPISEPR